MIWLYRCLTGMILLLLYPYGRLRAAGGDPLWQGRLGLDTLNEVDIWLHAASVGEVKVVGHLVRYVKKVAPNRKIHVTVMTRQGYKQAQTIMTGLATVSFFPLDAALIIDRMLNKLSPRVIAIAETEFWPNLIDRSHRRGISLVLVNGRISERSFGRYKKIRGLMTRLLGCYARLFVRTESDRDRLAFFGVSPEKMVVAGDMKFDAPLMIQSAGRLSEIRSRLGVSDNEFLLVAGSTRPGEEQLLLAACRKASEKQPHVRLAIAPRHLDRLQEINDLLDAAAVNHYKYGDLKRSEGVILVDRMGILNDLYMAADLAFVGGTLVDIGGHNILEPVWAGTPVLFGPYTGNVSEAAGYILDHDYGSRVATVEEMAALIIEIIDGRRKFARKEEHDLETSATALAGDYIVSENA